MTMSLGFLRSNCRQTSVDHCHTRGLRTKRMLALLCGLFVLGGCDAAQPNASAASTATVATTIQPEESSMWITIGKHRFAMTMADNAAARAFAAQWPLTLDMEELNGNEKHGRLPKALPVNASRPETIRNGDIMLYGSDILVVFYRTFESPYTYTRLGRVNAPGSLAKVLGRDSVQIVFSKD